MHALRLMTFNVQMLPWMIDADGDAGVAIDIRGRADRVVDVIEALPKDSVPHVIAFNEVFDEDSRDTLLTRLRPDWPHVVDKISEADAEEDAGLMLFSSLPFHTLPNGDQVLTGIFETDANDDKWSSKGFGIVQVGAPAEVTTIVFTHMQASYDSEDQYRDVRVKQFDQIKTAVDGLVGTTQPDWQNVIVVGDLNVRGDSGASSDEWSGMFEVPETELFTRLDDGWHSFMHPPADPTDHDPGYTNIDIGTGHRQRLDYQCVSKPVDTRRALVPHHMRVRIRNASDHFSLESVIQSWSPRCTPSDAVDLLATVSGTSQPSWPTTARTVPLDFVHEGSLQWVWVSEPGTYTVNPAPDVTYELYAVDNLSDPLTRLDTVHVSELPASVQPIYKRAEVDREGGTYVSRTPFFIAARTTNGQTGKRNVVVLEHRGDSPATAIRLRLHDKVESGFPVGQQLGNDDTCWFKATLAPSYASTARDEVFTVRNPTGGDVKATLHDAALGSLDSTGGADPELTLTHRTKGDETVLVSLRRAADTQAGFAVHWFSPMSYLLLDEPLGLHVDDESGSDWNGDDEIILSVSMDGDSLLNDVTWDDADTGERWPGLSDAIRQKIWARMPGVLRVGFVGSIGLSYVESDVNAQGFQLVDVKVLAKSEPVTKHRRTTMHVPDVIKDGTYSFYCTLSKLP